MGGHAEKDERRVAGERKKFKDMVVPIYYVGLGGRPNYGGALSLLSQPDLGLHGLQYTGPAGYSTRRPCPSNMPIPSKHMAVRWLTGKPLCFAAW